MMNNSNLTRMNPNRCQLRRCAVVMTVLISTSFISSLIMTFITVAAYAKSDDADIKATTGCFMFVYLGLVVLVYYLFEVFSGLSRSSHIAVSTSDESWGAQPIAVSANNSHIKSLWTTILSIGHHSVDHRPYLLGLLGSASSALSLVGRPEPRSR